MDRLNGILQGGLKLRKHLTLKEIGAAIGVRETYAGQAFDPALAKVARVYLQHPRELLAMLLEAAGELDRLEQARFERDLPERIARQCGGRPLAD